MPSLFGNRLERLIVGMSALPMLQVKLIAEPWDCGGLYQVGGFPNWDVWGEWNGKYRDDVRRFIKGDAGVKSAFATRIAGSADLYHVNNRCMSHSAQQCYVLRFLFTKKRRVEC